MSRYDYNSDEDGKDIIIKFLGVVTVLGLGFGIYVIIFVVLPGQAKSQEIEQAFEKQGCYMDDNLPVTKFTDWYEKNGWICEKK